MAETKKTNAPEETKEVLPAEKETSMQNIDHGKKENPALCTMRLPNGLQYCIRMRKRTPRIIFLYLFRKMENGK